MKNRKQMMAIAGVIFAIGAIAAQAADLPAGYTAVDAIVAPRGAYIDTKYKPNQNSRTMMDVTVQGKMEYWFSVMEESYTKGAYALCNDDEYYIYYAVTTTAAVSSRRRRPPSTAAFRTDCIRSGSRLIHS